MPIMYIIVRPIEKVKFLVTVRAPLIFGEVTSAINTDADAPPKPEARPTRSRPMYRQATERGIMPIIIQPK